MPCPDKVHCLGADLSSLQWLRGCSPSIVERALGCCGDDSFQTGLDKMLQTQGSNHCHVLEAGLTRFDSCPIHAGWLCYKQGRAVLLFVMAISGPWFRP